MTDKPFFKVGDCVAKVGVLFKVSNFKKDDFFKYRPCYLVTNITNVGYIFDYKDHFDFQTAHKYFGIIERDKRCKGCCKKCEYNKKLK